MLSFLAVILLSYLLGSIPTSVWVGKIYKKVDIREHGSGNAGATNTFRVLGWKAGSVVALIDMTKGFVAAGYISTIAYTFGGVPETVGPWETEIFIQLLAGMSAITGHMYPLYANFKGGKGVITAAGMLFAIEPISISIVLAVFLIVLGTSRYVSLSSIIASLAYPITLLVMRYFIGMDIDGSLIVLTSIIALFIVFKHKDNISRLLAGNENRISSFSPAKGKLNE